jgi:hypothetical protein
VLWDDPRVSVADAYFQIRATRAEPPGFAAGDEERRKIYGAALDQFEELMTAAGAATPRSRPLPLFYALSQAGRAIAAARAEEDWQLRGHGLSAPSLDVSDVCDLLIHPAPSRTKSGGVDSFGAIATLGGSESLSNPVSIGALWASLPGACEYLPEDDRWLRPLHAVPREPGTQPAFDCTRLSADLIGVRGKSLEDARVELGDYPLASDVDLPTVQNIFVREMTPFGHGVLARWTVGAQDYWEWTQARDRILPLEPLTGHRWLRPALSGAALDTTATWWALLFGLSMLARYEPGAWVAALDLDRPGLAAQLTMLLDLALQAVPALVVIALRTSASRS